MDGLRKIVLQPGPKVSTTRRAKKRRWRHTLARFERNEVDGSFSAGSLGNGIGSTGQAQEIPEDQEHNADELRKRRREMEQPAP